MATASLRSKNRSISEVDHAASSDELRKLTEKFTPAGKSLLVNFVDILGYIYRAADSFHRIWHVLRNCSHCSICRVRL